MKKKVLSLLVAMTLVFAYAAPVAATEATEPAAVPVEVAAEVTPDAAGEVVSDDPAIQAAYDAYKAVESALANGDLAALRPAYEKMVSVSFDTDAQQEEFEALVEEKIGYDEYLVTLFSAAYVIDAADKYEAYLADKNASTAYEFVAAVDIVTEDMELDMEAFIPGISADYEDAKTNYLPAENVMNVFNAYVVLQEELDWASYGEYFIEACEGFEAVLDDFNALTEEELDQLAVLMKVENGEAAWNKIFADWVLANIILEVGEAYTAYYENPNEETAAALVAVYERVFQSEDFFTDEEFDKLYEFFFDIDDVYADAQALLAGNDEPVIEDEPVTDIPADGTPATGDDFNAAPYAALMVIAAAVAVMAVKRRKVQ